MPSLREAEAAYDDSVIGESTVAETFEAAAARFEHRPAQYYKGGVYDRSLVGPVLEPAPPGEFRSLSYDDMREIVRNLATGFRDIGLDTDDRVAIFSHTRMEWAQADYAILAAGGVTTTIYPTSSEQQCQYLLEHPGASGVVVENVALLERVLAVEAELPDLEYIVVIDDMGGHDATDRSDVYSLADVHDRGATAFDPTAYHDWLDQRRLSDLASIIYTSGTTGRPKGVQLTHHNFRANINQIRRRFAPRDDKPPGTGSIDETTRVVSYLPLAHVFERTAGHFLMFASGASVAYAESPDTLRDDFSTVEPTTATSVPRVYQQIYRAIREEAESSALKARIFHWATDVGQAYHQHEDPGISLKAKRWLANKLVFGKVKRALGGQIEFLISGGGSLSPDLCSLYHGMGMPILEGYGLTETAPVISVNPPEAPKIGTIGPPLVDVETKLDDSVPVPDEYADAGNVGELLVRGPNVSAGYLNNPGANERAYTEDGWFRSGDLLKQREDDYFVFLERLKELYVLSTGKNVAPGPIEDAFASSRLIDQCMVLGDDRPFVGALVVPDIDGIQRWADANDVDLPAAREDICAHPRILDAVGAEVEEVNQQLERFERIKEFRLVPEEFSEANDLLTPTMKKKRRNILDRFDHLVEDIYTED